MDSKNNNTYYILIAGKRVGPLTVQDLKLRGLTSDMLVWKEGETGWFRAEKFQELKSILTITHIRRKKFEFLRQWRIPIVICSVSASIGAIGFVAVGWFKSGRSEFQSIVRAPDDEDDQAANLAQQKKSDAPPTRKNPEDVAALEYYHRLIEGLSLDRFLAGTMTIASQNGEDVQVVPFYEKLAEETSDPEFKRFANEAIALWKERAAIGLPRVSRSSSVFDPAALWEQVQPEQTEEPWFLLERRFRRLWTHIVDHVKDHLQSDELRANPELAALDRNLGPATEEYWNSTPALVNKSGTSLNHCTVAITLETPWGLQITNCYYREVWSSDSKWVLNSGWAWGTAGMRQTESITFSVWSDQGYLVNKQILFEKERQAILTEALAFANAGLDRGEFSIVSKLSTGITQNNALPADVRTTAEELKMRAGKIELTHERIRRAVDSQTPLIGAWQFGLRQGPIGMRLLEAAEQPVANGIQTGPTSENQRYECHLYDPNFPSADRSLSAEIVFSPDENSFAFVMTGVPGEAAASADKVPNLLLSEKFRELKFVPVDDALRCRMPTGLQVDLIAESHPEKTAKLERWTSADRTWRPAVLPKELPGLSANLLPAPPELSPSNIDWKLGEIRRSSPADSGRPVEAVTQVRFSGRGTTIFSVGKNSWLEARDTRTGELEYGIPFGPMIAATGTERYLATAGRGGTWLYKRARKEYEQALIKIPAQAVLFNPGGSRLITTGRDHLVRILNLDGKEEAQAKLEQAIQAAAISPDGRLLVIATADQQLHILDIKQDLKHLDNFEGSLKKVELIEVSPDNAMLLVAGDVDPDPNVRPTAPRISTEPIGGHYEIQLWDRESKSLVHSVALDRPATCLAVSNDWKTAVTGHPAGPISVWDLTRGREVHWFVGHTDHPNSLAISPDRRFVLSGGEDGHTILWGLPE